MTPLFSKLLSFASAERGCTEDFFTEVVAAVLRHHPAVLWRWLGLEPSYDSATDHISVETQARRKKLREDDSDSIIDLVVYRTHSSRSSVIYLESKVDSGEGHEQLRRYAEQLDKEDADAHLLVYVTRDYVSPKSVHEGACHMRWHSFYHALAGYDECPLVTETKRLMEHLRMDQSTIFTPQDLFVANESPNTFTKMAEVLDRVERSGDFRYLSVRSNTMGASPSQLFQYRRYVLKVKTSSSLWAEAETEGLDLYVGFELDQQLGSPMISVFVEIPYGRSEAEQKSLVKLFDKFAEQRNLKCEVREKWEVRNREKPYAKLCRWRPLSLRQDENDVDGVAKFLIDSLKNLGSIRTTKPVDPAA